MPILRQEPDGTLVLRVKVVPGARADQIAGPLGDRLKIRVASPPEDGKANRAVCRLLAGMLGVRESNVEVVSGHTHPEKTVRISGATDAARRLGLHDE